MTSARSLTNKEIDYEYLFKIVICGDSSCGKSKILHRFTTGQFEQNSSATIGCEFISKTIDLNDN